MVLFDDVPKFGGGGNTFESMMGVTGGKPDDEERDTVELKDSHHREEHPFVKPVKGAGLFEDVMGKSYKSLRKKRKG